MEYALEGHGYVKSRVIRQALSRSPLSEEQRASVDAAFEFTQGAASFAERWTEDELFEVLLRGAGVEPPVYGVPPELLTALREHGEGGPLGGLALAVATAAKQVFDRAWKDAKVRLTHCSLTEHTNGGVELVLGIQAPTVTAEVRPGDRVNPGTVIALLGDPGGGGVRLEVLTRIFRVVCANGMMHEEDAEGLVDARWLAMPCDTSRIVEEIERRVDASLDGRALEVVVRSYRDSAVDPLERNGGQLAQFLRRELSFDTWHAVMERYRRARSFSRWGFANALTAEAHWSPHFAEAAVLERLGGFVLSAADIYPVGYNSVA